MKEKYNMNVEKIISLIFALIFFIVGILNIFLVHPVPGIFYLVLSFIYLPAVNIFLKNKLGFKIPLALKIVIALIILWATLAVGDLAEILAL